MNIFLSVFLLLSLACPAFAEDMENRFFSPEYSKKVSMDFKGVSLTDVLKIFSKQSGMNFIAAQDVSERKITLFMENIPVEEALNKILDANGLTYSLEPGSDVFVVKVKSDTDRAITRIYQLKHASVPSSKIRSTITISGGSSSGASASSSASSSSSSGSPSSGSSSDGIFAAVKVVLSKSGTLVEDPRTNSLIVTDVESQFPVIENTIAKLDVPVPQILIEVEMLDISKITSDLMGVKFGDTPLSFKGAVKDTLLPFNQSQILQKLDTTLNSAAGVTNPYAVGTISSAGMTIILNFLRTQTDTRNLARPRLLTLNNETAEIKISANEAIGVIKSTSTSTTSTTPETETAERVPTGIFLTVTPQADLLTREIIMAVAPKVIQARLGSIVVNGQTAKDAEERGSQSILKIHDGETIIIGGLLRTDDSNITTKLPFLGDLPFVGAAFRHKKKDTTQRELVIFITPHIIDDVNSGQWLSAAVFKAGGKEGPLLDRMDAMERELSSMESGK